MKKIICILISVIMIFSASIAVHAAGAVHPDTAYSSYMPSVDGEYRSMILNDYYKNYYNDIFEAEYANLKSYSIAGMTENTLAVLTDENFTYATIILNENDTDNYAEYNRSVLSAVFEDDDMLYIGDTTPFTVVKLTKENADKLTATEQVKGIFPAFFAANIVAVGVIGEKTLGNVTGDSDVTSADARMILRYSAGLESVDKNSAKSFYFCADMNFDGSVSSADARLALRTAAGLEKTVSITFGSVSSWSDFR